MSTFRAWRLMLLVLGSLLMALPVAAQDTPAQPLTATFTSDNGSYSFQYPGDWVVEERDGVAVLATSDSALASAQPARGEMVATLIALPTDALPGLEADAPLEAVLAVGTISVEQDQNCDSYSTPEPLEINGRRALRAVRMCGSVENMLLVVELGGDTVGMIGAALGAGSLNKFLQTFVAIGGTLEFAPTLDASADEEAASEPTSDLTETFTSSGAISLNYPDGWRVEESADGVIAITDGEESIFPEPRPGQLAGYLVIAMPQSSLPIRLSEMMDRFVASMPDPSIFTEREDLSIGGHPAVLVRATANNADAVMIIVELDQNVFAILNALHMRGRLTSFEPTLYTILGSIEIAPDLADAASDTSGDAPLEEIAADDLAELDATFITDDGSLSFQYPEDWYVIEQDVQGQAFYIVSPTEDVVDGPTGEEPYLVVQVFNLTALAVSGLPDDPEGRTLATLNMMQQDTGAQFTDPQNFSLNGEVVGQMDLMASPMESRLFLRYLTNNQFVVLHVFTGPGELEDLMPTLLAMVDSLTDEPRTAVEQAESQLDVQDEPEVEAVPTQVEPTLVAAEPLSLELDETYTNDEGTLTLHYPTGWTLDNTESLLTLQNVEELSVQSGDTGLEVAHGEYRVILGIKPSEGAGLEDVFTRETADADVGDLETLTIGDHDAVSAPIDLRVMSGTLYVVDLGNDQVLIVTAIHAPGERATLEPLVSELVKALELLTPD